MNTLLIHQEQEKTGFSRLLIKSMLLSVFSFMLLLSGLLFQHDLLQPQPGTQPLSRGLLQASFTAITSLPMEAHQPVPADAHPSNYHAEAGERQAGFFTRSCRKISVQLRLPHP